MQIPHESTQSPDSKAFLNAVRRLSLVARRQRQRRMLVLGGSREWCIEYAIAALEELQPESVHWFTRQAPPGTSSSHGSAALGLLGTELDALVFDAWSGFDPDAFGALTGTLRAGGILLLLAPPRSDWPEFPDPQNARITVEPYEPDSLTARFITRLVSMIAADPDVTWIEQGEHITAVTDAPEPEPESVGVAAVEPPCRTDDQRQAVAAVVRVATGHRRRPVVLTADRGRGKSAALGIAAAQLILDGRSRILLTGPSQASVQTVLDHARALLPEDRHTALRFVAPDALMRDPQAADLLLVDEAAALPTPLLCSLLHRYARIAFATTVHGYEGTGRGFALRFTGMLDKYTNSWKAIQLSEPIRWAAGDPLERLAFRMLLLDANAAADEVFRDVDCDRFTIERLDRDLLLQDETSLGELFGLLVLAHYRTRPLDLRHLLDGPNLSVYVLRLEGHIAATALLAEEGGFDTETAAAVCSAARRPRGHLLPETLAAHQGLCEALQLKAARIMRIAVHPAVLRRRLGTRLLKHVIADSLRDGYDYIGSSFGATADLLRFWNASGAMPVRVGFQRGAASGCHSVVVLLALSRPGEALLERARERFFAHVPHQLADSLRDLDGELVQALLPGAASHAPMPGEADWLDLRGFASGQRLLENTIGALWRLACFALTEAGGLSRLESGEVAVLIARVMQKKSWQECAALIGASGRGEVLAMLRSAVARLIRYYSADETCDHHPR